MGIKIAGPGIILSFLVTGLACTLAACQGLLVLRFTSPALPRPFRCPGGKAVALAGALVCLGLMLSLPAASWWRLGLWLMAGLAVYVPYALYSSRQGSPSA